MVGRTPRAHLHRSLIAVVAGLNAVAGLGGAWGLASGVLDLGSEVEARLPWASTSLAGVALALAVAVPNAVVTVLAVRGDRRTGAATVAAGVVLVAWILVELAFILEFSFFHPLYVAVGLLMMWLGLDAIRATTGVPARILLAEGRDVLVDLPVFLTAPVYRRWHLRWGATDSEVRQSLPGDDLVARASYVSTRAIHIDAPPERIWPWLVQVGCGRAGFYSDDLLDNLGHPSAQTLVPALQGLEVGQLVPMSPRPTEATAFRVASFAEPRELLWSKPDSTWAWLLTSTGSGTRVVTRIRAGHDWRHPASALLGVLLLEFGDFAMLRRMLRGIKRRAEAAEVRARGSSRST